MYARTMPEMTIAEYMDFYERRYKHRKLTGKPVYPDSDFVSIRETKKSPEWMEPFQRRDLTEIFPG